MTYKPQNEYLTFRKEKYEEKTKDGMLLSDEEKKSIRGQIGTVLEVSPFIPVGEDGVQVVKSGDRIYYDRHNAFDVHIDGEEVSVCRYRDVMLVI
jgi:co-chaperonin GroES (HSP10)